MKDVLKGRRGFPFLTLKEYQKVHLSLYAQIVSFILDAVQLPILVPIENRSGFFISRVFFP